jgi:hypothetical protein
MGKTVIVTGYAKMPTGTMMRALSGTLGMGAVVDLETHTVIEGWVSLYAPRNQEFAAERLKGQSLVSDESDFIHRIQDEYWGAAQGAICQCFRDMVRRYREQLEARGLMPANPTRMQ